MFKRIGLLLSAACCWIYGSSQYMVGKGVQSIEPDSTIFSLALGGYGAPRDGRFTLTWQKTAKLQPLKAIGYSGGKVYAVNTGGEFISGKLDGNWTTTGKSAAIVALADVKGKLYAVNSANELLAGESIHGTIGWVKKGQIGYIISMAAVGNTLYGINDRQQLITIENAETKPVVKIIGEVGNVISLAANGNSLYALRSDHSIWKCSLENNKIAWVKIARLNGFTYTTELKHIGFMENRAFGVDADGNIYRAAHNSRGDLSARSLAIRSGNVTAVIVSVDLVGIKYNFINEVKDYIYKKRKIAPQHILVNISHTHFAPVTQAWRTWQPFNQQPDSMYLYGIVKPGIIKSIEDALDNMKPATIHFGRGATRIGHNRSSENLETPYDDAVDVVKIKYNSIPVPDIMVLTGCHPVFPADNEKTYTISANYPGVTRRILEQKKIAGTAFFLQGCAGDINPREASDVQTGMNLSIDALAVLQGEMKKLNGKISCFLDTIAVPVKVMSQQEVIELKNKNLNREGDVSAEKNVRWADMMMEKFRNGDIAKSLPVYVQTINIGDWKLVGLSREVVTDYSLEIKKLWPEKSVSVAGYCNDVSSYLPVESHITRHTYEGDDSSFWYGEPALFPSNVLDIVLQQIKQKQK